MPSSPKDKIKIAVVGLGKMGLSHFAMVNAHPRAETIACDASGFLADVLDKYVPAPVFRDYGAMLDQEKPDAVVIATPSRLHAPMVRAALERGVHVFCEKPFCLDWKTSEALADLAETRGLVNQVGYHNRYVGAFREARRIVASGALGQINHVLAEAYGPVVLRPKRQSWRTQKEEGGGSLYDYAAHPLNLLNWFFGQPTSVAGSVLGSIFSSDTDDQVFSTLKFAGGTTAQLSVNWSDESQRKMTTRITLIGTNGRLFADRQECQLYLRKPVDALPGHDAGWSVRYTTDLTQDPWFYLRGEEYSHQLDAFITAVAEGRGKTDENDFRSAAMTDRSIAMILADEAGTGSQAPVPDQPHRPAPAPAPARRRWFGLF